MSIESDLKKDGIEVVGTLDTLSINTLARNIANKICKAFPEQNFVFQNLFITLSRIPMYIANMPNGFAEANYFYKNSSIYFKAGVGMEELEKYAMHEFIHYLQEIKDQKGNLIRLGLCEYGDLKIYGMALNEAAVQLMSAKALNQSQDIVKYYGISLPTNSPNYYPIICNLVWQMAYVTGEEALYDSTFYGTNLFKERFIELCGLKPFLKIQNNLDKIMNTEEKIIKLNNTLVSDDCEGMKAQKVASKIVKLKEQLKALFFETQECIYSSYFSSQFNRINTTADISSYRFRLYNYKNFIGITDNYSTFNNFYVEQMAKLDDKYESIINNVSLAVIPTSKTSVFFKKLKSLFSATVNFE